MITGIVKSEKSSPDCVEVFWTIRKLDEEKLKVDYTLHSVPFYFAGQMWQLLLTTVGRVSEEFDFLILLSISRITVSTEETPVDFPVVGWNMGILDGDGSSHYGRAGFASLAMASEWVTMADFSGPLLTHLRLQKDLYMPGDKITIALRLILDSRDSLIKDKQDPIPMLEQSNIISNVVAINVKDKTFYAEESILDGISDDIELKTSEWITGRMTVIDLPDCDPDDFECFLSFPHFREIERLIDYIGREVYDIAYKCQDPELKRESVQSFLRTLNVSSACGFLEMAERYHDQALKEECSEFFLKNARAILNTSEWLEFMAKRTKFANELIISYLDSIAA